MAKVHFGKLDLNVNKEVETFDWNGQVIEVKQYLPVEEKLKLINKIINETADDKMYFNPARQEVFRIINIFLAYTNISVTETQMKDIGKFYDMIVSSGLWTKVREYLDSDEYAFIDNNIWLTINKIEAHDNSVYGILENINSQYGDVQESVQQLLTDISESKDIELVSEIMNKLG